MWLEVYKFQAGLGASYYSLKMLTVFLMNGFIFYADTI